MRGLQSLALGRAAIRGQPEAVPVLRGSRGAGAAAVKYLSVCSGIEAATCAWHPLGWRPWAFSEIEPFPSAVLAHHYPETPNLGDMTRFQEWPDAAFDLLVGGTPCQSFSVAGLRKGLADPRGNLMLTYGAIAARYRPRWLVWENVPGVLSSNKGRDFGTFLGMLAELGYGFAYRVLDAQFFGVPQRRRRVFVVGCARGQWQRAAAVLFERHSLSGDPAPGRASGKGITCDPEGIAGTCSSKWSKGTGGPAGDEHYNLIAPTLLAQGNSTGGDRPPGTTVDTCESLIPVAFDTTQITSAANRSSPKPGDPCHTLARGALAPAVAFNWQNGGGYGNAHDGLGITVEGSRPMSRSQVAAVTTASAVRRLTPRECERLQGFPDDYTLVPHRGKPAADGPRYKALGNSMAVPCMAWIGRRIEQVEAIS